MAGQRGRSVRRVKSSIPDWPLSRATQLWALGLLSCPVMRAAPTKFRRDRIWCLVLAEETRFRECEHPEGGLHTPCAQRIQCKRMEGKTLFPGKKHS